MPLKSKFREHVIAVLRQDQEQAAIQKGDFSVRIHNKWRLSCEADTNVAERSTCREWLPPEFVLLLTYCVSILHAAWQHGNCPLNLTS